MPFVIAEPCSTCKDAACAIVCPVNIIHPGVIERDGERFDQYFINGEECIDCGICETECPVDAIYADDELPDQWKKYAEINQAFYKAL